MDQIIEYDLPAAAIADMETRYMPLTIKDLDDEEGFKLVHDARMDVKNHRIAVEKKRVALKADALTWGRKVDTEAKRLFGLLEPIETHLKNEELVITEEKKRIEAEKKREEELIIQRRVDELLKYEVSIPFMAVATMDESKYEATLNSRRLEWEAKQKAEKERLEKERLEREAEEKRLAEERARQDKIAVEQAEKEAEIQAEQDRLAEEKRLEQVKKEAAERALKEKAEAEIRAKAEADRQEALKMDSAVTGLPDKEKIFGYAVALETLAIPDVDSEEAEWLLNEFMYRLEDETSWLKKKAQSL